MPKLMMGSISYHNGDEELMEKRAEWHSLQLRWLESIKLTDYIFYRVEQGYPEGYVDKLQTTMQVESLSYENGLGPSAARNVLLKKLYESDCDWLMCMDDDRDLYMHYGINNFIHEITVNPALLALAKDGVLIKGVCPQRRPFKRENTEFGRIDTHWHLQKGCLDGCLQICFIPNLVKYGRKPVYFDEANDAKTLGMLPEDMQFDIEWIMNKNQIAVNLMMIIRDRLIPNKETSVVYDVEGSREACYAANVAAIPKYIRARTRNRFSDLRELNRHKNGYKRRNLPRTIQYQPTQSDYGKYKIIDEPSN